MKSCTVTIGQKQFTERHETDAMYLALSKAIKYMLKTYAVFAELNKQHEDALKENNKLSPCLYTITKFKNKEINNQP